MITFVQWLENNGMMELSVEEVNDAQEIWLLCHDMLPYFNNDMGEALISYCLDIIDAGAASKSPEEIGKTLGVIFVHSSHYSKKSAPIDYKQIVAKLKQRGEIGKRIADNALRAYSMYEMRPFTMRTIKTLG